MSLIRLSIADRLFMSKEISVLTLQRGSTICTIDGTW
jgi:hypothetical protein